MRHVAISRIFYFLKVFVLSAVISACSPTKYVPEDAYLLDKVHIQTDTKEVEKKDLSDYIRQLPNSYVLSLFRMQLGVYNLSGQDTTKWLTRTLRKIGQPPVIFDPYLTDVSAYQLKRFYINKGFYQAAVIPSVQTRKKRAVVTYEIESNKPYRIQNYRINTPSESLTAIAGDSVRSLIRKNQLFDVYVLDQERDRIVSRMRREGYYYFTREHLAYTADSANHQVDLTLHLRDYLMEKSDTLQHTLFKQMSVNRVIFNLIPSVSTLTSDTEETPDTLYRDRYVLIGSKNNFLTLKTLIESTFVTPGILYSDQDVERTYAALNALPPVKYSHISFAETDQDSLECLITVAEAKSLTLTSQAEVTFTEGYWGLAGNVGLVNRNLFKGAESLTLQGRFALEKQEDVIAQEWGVQAGVTVPRILMPFINTDNSRRMHGTTEFKSAFNYQFRPGEFIYTNVGGGVKYGWNTPGRKHSLDFIDLSYTYFPWISPAFRDSFLVTGKYNEYNYDDYFIMRFGYASSYSNFNANRPMRNYLTYRYGVETAGNVLYGISNLLQATQSAEGYHKIFGVRYSQYVRGEINATYHQILDKNNKFVYHAGAGLGYPYGNADIIPFERRFYSGGANSVRGWSESTLGPGTYERFSKVRRDYNQVGDVKLDLNFEYRSKMFWVLEGAIFADAGNIWTIREYENQPGGAFRMQSFWKQIALAYGIGVRMDFSFLIFRVDMGVKLFDPAAVDVKWKLPPSFSDAALHLAIGYPF